MLVLIAWLLPPRLWRKAATATSFIGQDDLGGPSYQVNLAGRYSESEISAIQKRRRILVRELNFQIIGLRRWRSWRPEIRLLGARHLQEALAQERGAIVWMAATVSGTLVGKMALHSAGYRAYQLTRAGHGFSTTKFGVRFLNPIWTEIEDRFIAGRATIHDDNAAEALTKLRAKLAENEVVIVQAVPQARRPLLVPFLRSQLPVAVGAIRLARETGAPLLPAFSIAAQDGSYDVTIQGPLSADLADDKSVAAAYAKRLEPIVLDHPAQWAGWGWLQFDDNSEILTPSAVCASHGISMKLRAGGAALHAVSGMLARKLSLFAQLLVRFVRYSRDLVPLMFPARGSALYQAMRRRPSNVFVVLSRYVATGWDTRTRITRFIVHHKIVDEISGLINCVPGDLVELVKLWPIDPRYRLTLDQPDWLRREGSLVFSLWDGVHRIFHLGFCLAVDNGQRVAFVGLIQGRNRIDPFGGPSDLLECYRSFTKAAWGMRPRDFLVEVFRMFCKAIGVEEIRAVRDANQPQRQIDHDIKLSYDTIWTERSGGRGDCRDLGGFFILSVTGPRRRVDEIPSKKKTMYARRYAMLDAVEREIRTALNVHISEDSDCAGAV